MKSNSTIIFIGRSGSGKGTQIELLKEHLYKSLEKENIFHFESGEHFRNFISKEGYTNELMRDIISNGNLAPDFITEWLLVDSLVRNFNENQLLILDGYPRTITQCETLDSAMNYYKRTNCIVVHIEVSEDEVRTRMKARNRNDDKSDEIIEKRIGWYNDNVLPTLQRMRESDLYDVIDINGEQDIDIIHDQIKQHLKTI